jgi:hypothetical protein
MSFLAELKAKRRELRYIRKMHARGYYSNFGEERISLEYLNALSIPVEQKYAVDIAAADGLGGSNTYRLFSLGYAGLAVEGDPGKFAFMSNLYRSFSQVFLMRVFITPENINEALLVARVPRNFAYLSLDIDSYDYFVLEKMLQNYEPAVICAEFNEKIPPPLKFTIKYDPTFSWDYSHCYGQSICKLFEFTQKFAYDLVSVEYNNAFLVSRKLNKWKPLSAEEAYKTGYLDKPDRLQRLSANADMEPVLGMAPKDAAEFINKKFSAYAGKYTLEF